jgi:hypothetical protein
MEQHEPLDDRRVQTHEERKPYQPPQLVVHGTIRELTQSADQGAQSDGLRLGSVL